MEKVTFVGPYGATFTHNAYVALAKAFGAPSVTPECYVPVSTNGEVLETIVRHGGYGALAMETLAEARVTESLDSLVRLLRRYASLEECPVRILGAVAMRLHFCLMAREGVWLADVAKVVAHPKSFGPCEAHLKELGVPRESVSSNGEAARLIAEDPSYASAAALGPRAAAEHYGLRVLAEAFEDEEAVTTFFLIGPPSHPPATGQNNRVLLIFKVPDESGALLRILAPLAEEHLSMSQIHSVGVGKGEYHFVIEFGTRATQLATVEGVLEKIRTQVEEHLFFGPFQVLSS